MSGTISLGATELSFGERDGRVFITIVRTGDLSLPVHVDYNVTPESATPGSDYIGVSGQASMIAGQASVTVPFDMVDDNQSESTETFIVSLLGVDSGEVGLPRSLRVNILDDENPILPPTDPPLVSNYSVTQQTLISNVEKPIKFEFSPVDPNVMYVVEHAGRIHAFNYQTGQDLGLFINLEREVNTAGDHGLMDIAFHPDFVNNPYVYAFYIVDPPDARGDQIDEGGNRYIHVVRYTADASQNYLRVVPGSGVVLLGNAGQSILDIGGHGDLSYGDPVYANVPSSERYVNASRPAPVVVDGIKQNYLKMDSYTHSGGAIEFGPDGMLYISTGDGMSPSYPDPHGIDVQNLNSLSGKVLRINPMTGQGLATNPYYTPGASLDLNISKVYQVGLRNPFSMGWDDQGRLFITDTGWNTYEEINVGGPGANFGWPYFEGKEGGVNAVTNGYDTIPGASAFYAAVNAGTIVVTPPFLAQGHAVSAPGFQNQVITGGTVIYTGDKYPTEFQNDFFFTNFEFMRTFTVDTNNRLDIKYLYTSDDPYAPVHFAQGPDGYIYYSEYFGPGFSNGSIGRLHINALNAPSVSVSAVPSVTEGAGVMANVTFSLNTSQTSAVTVTYSTTNGTALAGQDFTGVTNATAIIPAGQLSVTVQLAILNDGTFEGTESFSVVLNGATLNGQSIPAFGPAQISILDDEAAPPNTNLLVNGSFEQPTIAAGGWFGGTSAPGWTAISGGSIEIWNAHLPGVTAADGVNHLELDYEAARDGFYQDVPTVAGQSYTLTFNARLRPEKPASTQALEVVWNNTVVATLTPNTNWTTHTYTVTGTGAADRLTIREATSGSTDGAGALLDNFKLVGAGAPNQPPTAGNDTATTNEDVAVVVSVLTNDSDPQGTAVSVSHINGTPVAVGGSVDVGPANVSRNANGTLTVTPDLNYNGAVNFTYRVTDGSLFSGDASVAVTVNAVNDAPAVTIPIPDQGATINQAFNFQFASNAFTDVDSASLTYTARQVGGAALPAWLNFDGATRTFSGTPPATGSLTVEVVASDGSLSATDAFVLNVTAPNDPPIAGADTATTNEDVAVAISVLANDSDPQGTAVTVSHINGTIVAVGGSVDVGPAIVTRNANGTLTVTPDANYNGAVNFTYRVTDGSLFSSDASVAVTVNPVNDAPVVSNAIPDQAATTSQAFSFQFATNAFTDVDNASLTYTAQLVGGGALPGWLSFNPSTRAFSGTPTATGQVNVQVTASDGSLSVSDAFLINVAAPNTNLLVNGSFEQPIVAAGGWFGGTSVPGWTAISGGSIEIWNAHLPGVTAADGVNHLELDYEAARDGFFQDVQTVAGQSYTLTFNARLRPEKQASTQALEVVWNNTVVATLTPNTNWTLHTYTLAGTGALDRLTIREATSGSTDGAGALLDNFKLIGAGAPNSPPTAGNDTGSTNEDTAVSLSVLTNDSDPQGTAVSISHVNGSAIAVGGTVDVGPANVTRNANGTLTVTPDANYNGAVNFTYRVTDGSLFSNDASVAVTLNPVNDAPIVANAIPDQGATVNQAFSFQFATNAFTDVDNASLTYTAQLVGGGSLPAWLSFNATTRTFSGTPPATGSVNVQVTASDGSLSVSDSFLINAGVANQPPVAGADTATTNEDIAVSISVLANDSDPNGTTPTVSHINGTAVAVGGSVDVGPANVTRNANGTLTVTPDANYNGAVNFTYRITDGSLFSNDASVGVTVNPVNDAPVLANAIPDQAATTNQAFSFQFATNAFTDVDNASLTYTAQLVGGGALPGWLSFNAATRTFSGTPTATGQVNVQVAASDGSLSANDAFLINVAAPNTNLLVNGSFEQPTVAAGGWFGGTSAPGWTAISGGSIEIWNAHLPGVTAADGVNHLELDYEAARDGFYQDVSTAAGQAYTLTFSARLRPEKQASTQGVEVVWGNTVVATLTPSTNWTTQTYTFIGTGGANRLTIREATSGSTDGAGALLDNFKLVAGQTFTGTGSANTLTGTSGADTLEGSGGADTMSGGAGADSFLYRFASEGADTISDFLSGTDKFAISAAGFGGALAVGTAVRFAQSPNPAATGSTGQFLFDTNDHLVLWDPDGAGATSPILIATLTGVNSLSANDFLVVS